MTKTTVKNKVSRDNYETALAGYVSNDNRACLLAAERDKEIEQMDSKYNPQFETLRREMEAQFAIVRAYCHQHRSELFTDAKCIEAYGASVGYREGKDKVVIQDGHKEKDIIAVMARRTAMSAYLRTTLTLDKIKIIKEKPKGLEKLGVKVVQEEAFFLEPVKRLI
jgi:phage host-nuclease inhibitor protein Gam